MTTVYDNKATMCREWWRNGRLVASMSAKMIMSEHCTDESRHWGAFPDHPANKGKS